MQAPRLLRQLADRLPRYELLPRAHARYSAIVSAREAAQRSAASHAVDVSAPFPYAARSPSRTFSLESGVHLSLEDRWFICGTIGCGKTTLAQELMHAYRRLYPMASSYVLDSKGDDHFNRAEWLWDRDEPPPFVGPGEEIVWRPGTDDVDAYSDWFEGILKARQPCVVYVDELSSLSRGPRSHAEGYVKLLKQGRSLHQCVITLSQEAVGIPRQTRNQIMHLIRMRLQDDIDANRLDRILQGNKDPRREPSRPHGLWYRRLDRAETPREFADWRALLS